MVGRLFKVSAIQLSAKAVVGPALGAALSMAVALPFVIHAHGPNRPLGIPELRIFPDDEWLFGYPYFEAHTEANTGAA